MSRYLCRLEDIPPGQGKSFELDGQPIFLIRQSDRVFAYRNRCPHLGIELNWQPDRFLDADGQFIQCAMHGALFIIGSGECIAGPCLGQRLSPLPLRLDGDAIYLS